MDQDMRPPLSPHLPTPGFDSFFTAKGTEGTKEGTFLTKPNKINQYQHDRSNLRFRVRTTILKNPPTRRVFAFGSLYKINLGA